jgi:hypothetical protein
MKTPMLEILIGILYPLLVVLIGVSFRLYKSITVLKVYTRQICVEMKIPCGKDLD